MSKYFGTWQNFLTDFFQIPSALSEKHYFCRDYNLLKQYL